MVASHPSSVNIDQAPHCGPQLQGHQASQHQMHFNMVYFQLMSFGEIINGQHLCVEQHQPALYQPSTARQQLFHHVALSAWPGHRARMWLLRSFAMREANRSQLKAFSWWPSQTEKFKFCLRFHTVQLHTPIKWNVGDIWDCWNTLKRVLSSVLKKNTHAKQRNIRKCVRICSFA